MAFNYPFQPTGNFKTIEGDVEIDAFTGESRLVNIPVATMPIIADETFFGNVSGADAPAIAILLSSLAGDNLTWNSTTNALDATAGSSLPSISDDSFLANISGGSAAPTELLFTDLAGTGLTWNATTHQLEATGGLAAISDDNFLANISGGSAAPVAVPLSTLAGAGLTGGADAILNVTAGAGGSIVVNTNDIQRAALTGAITASADSNTTAFGALAAKSVLANSTNSSAVPAALAGSAAFQHLRVNSTNTGLEWAVLSLSEFPTQATDTVLGNVSGSTTVPSAVTLSSLAGSGLTYNGTLHQFEATGTSVPTIADKRVLGNDSGSTTTPTATTVTQVLDWVDDTDDMWFFDGVDDRAAFGDFNDCERTDSFTWSAWIRVTSNSTSPIISKLGAGPTFQGIEWGYEVTGRLYLILSNTLAASNYIAIQTVDNSVGAGTMTHVAMTYNGSGSHTGVTFLVNGVVVSKNAPQGPGTVSATTVNSEVLTIGRREPASIAMRGVIKHVAKFTSALTTAQVLELYNNGVPPNLNSLPTAPAPVFWAKLDATDTTGAGGIADNGSGNHDGTAAGGLALGLSSIKGGLAVRTDNFWDVVLPTTAGQILLSRGPGLSPIYGPIGLSSFPAITAKSVIANSTNALAVPTAFAGTAAFQYLRVNAGNGALEWDTLATHASTSIAYTGNSLQRAALTGAVTAAANSNTTAFGALAAKSVLANATNASAVPAALAAATARHVLRDNAANTALEFGYPIAGRANSGTAFDLFQFNFLNGTHTTASLGGTATDALVQYNVDVTSLLAAIDSTSIIVSSSTLQRAALTGAIAASDNSNATLFAGIRDNGSSENDRTNLNFLSGDSITLAITDDSGSDELEIKADYTGTTSEVTIASATGNLGTINIAALVCGGSVRVTSASSAYQIEGFTSKAAGFWFYFEADQGLTNNCTLFNEDATATSTNRIKLPLDTDLQAGHLRGIFYYRNSRWNLIGANPQRIGEGAGVNVTVGSTDVDIVASDDINLTASTGDITATGNSALLTFNQILLTGALRLGVVQDHTTGGLVSNLSLGNDTAILRVDTGGAAWSIDGITGGAEGRILIITTNSNVTGTLVHSTGSASSANNLISCGGSANRSGNRYAALLLYDGTDSIWRVVADTA